MRAVQRFNRHEIENDPSAMARRAAEFGLDEDTLGKHLSVMAQVAEGRVTKAARAWVTGLAQEQGYSAAAANEAIDRVLAMPTPQERAQAYVRGASGNVDPQIVERAMDLHRHWQRESAVIPIEDRLEAADKTREQGQYRYRDSEQLKHARAESDGVRKALETAMISSGLKAPPPATLEEAQARAQARADGVADRLERRSQSDAPESLRDTIATAYETESAIAAKVDVGLLPEGTSSASLSADYDRMSALGQSLVGADE